MLGFKAVHSASATIAGIEVAHTIRKKQFANDNSLAIPALCGARSINVFKNKITINQLKFLRQNRNDAPLYH